MSRSVICWRSWCLRSSRTGSFLKPAKPPSCAFSTTPSKSLNPLLNLSGLACSKEAQYFSKERRIPREEFSANLQLIRSSEVDPFAPAPGASPTVIAALRRAQRGESDMQTAFSLAMSNLLIQLEVSKAEAKQATESLKGLQERYQRQERHALLLVFGIVVFISISYFKPDALETVRTDVLDLQRKLLNFDWQWLGHPPKFRSTQPSAYTEQVHDDATNPDPLQLPEISRDPVSETLTRSVHTDVVGTASPMTTSWSRFFWASSSDTS